jgi:hypothetical protein
MKVAIEKHKARKEGRDALDIFLIELAWVHWANPHSNHVAIFTSSSQTFLNLPFQSEI